MSGESVVDARVRSVESEGFPGPTYQLCIPHPDPQTGDGAELVVEMVGGSATVDDGRTTVRGFVSRQDQEYEHAYRRGDWQACMSARDHERWAYEYVLEEWTFPWTD